MSIPEYAYDMKEDTYKALTNLPYMCGASKAYLIKDAEKAAQISVTDFLALSAMPRKPTVLTMSPLTSHPSLELT